MRGGHVAEFYESASRPQWLMLTTCGAAVCESMRRYCISYTCLISDTAGLPSMYSIAFVAVRRSSLNTLGRHSWTITFGDAKSLARNVVRWILPSERSLKVISRPRIRPLGPMLVRWPIASVQVTRDLGHAVFACSAWFCGGA